MKKIASLILGLSFVLGTVAFAQDSTTPNTETKKETKTKHKHKNKKDGTTTTEDSTKTTTKPQ